MYRWIPYGLSGSVEDGFESFLNVFTIFQVKGLEAEVPAAMARGTRDFENMSTLEPL